MDKKLMALHRRAGLVCGIEHTCRDKIDYKSEPSAQKACEAIMQRGKARNELEPYPCVFCKGWHIGRKMSLTELKDLAGRCTS